MGKIAKQFNIQNIDTLQKARHFASCFIYKNPDTLRYAICHEILKLAFMYKKNDTLRYVMLKKKIQTLRKKQDNLRYVFISKNPYTLHYTIFIEFLKLAEGRGAFLYAKTMQFALHFCKQKTMHFALHFTYKNPDTLRYIFIAQKQYTLCYVFYI